MTAMTESHQRLTSVLYTLMKEHVPTGVILEAIQDIELTYEETNPNLEALASEYARMIEEG